MSFCKSALLQAETRWPWRHLFLHLPHPPPHWQRASFWALLERLQAKLDTLQAEPSSAKGNTRSAPRQLGWPGWRKREGGTNKSGIVVCPARTSSPEHLTIMNFSWQRQLEALMTAATGKFVPRIPCCSALLVWIIRAAVICTGASHRSDGPTLICSSCLFITWVRKLKSNPNTRETEIPHPDLHLAEDRWARPPVHLAALLQVMIQALLLG